MYTLTLTKTDRKAIDHVGNRNWNGHSLYLLLWGDCEQCPNDIDWDEDGLITFTIGQEVAWDIRENWESEGRLIPHFNDVLKGKVQALINEILKNDKTNRVK